MKANNDIQDIEETATYVFLFGLSLSSGLLTAIYINIFVGMFLLGLGFFSSYSMYIKLKKGWYFRRGLK